MNPDTTHGADLQPAVAEMQRRQLRRLDTHREAVRVLRREPGRASVVVDVLTRWVDNGLQSPSLDEWRRIIAERDWDAVLEDSERGDLLRRGSPFTFVLAPEVRAAILSQYSRRQKGTA